MSQCDSCAFYDYDEYAGEYFCEANIDEDDMERMMFKKYANCPYYRDGDEYKTVRHQM